MRNLVPATIMTTALLAGCGGSPSPKPSPPIAGGKPEVTPKSPAAGATELSGNAYNVDRASTKVVIYALINEWCTCHSHNSEIDRADLDRAVDLLVKVLNVLDTKAVVDISRLALWTTPWGQ
jgi:hypothetical protein